MVLNHLNINIMKLRKYKKFFIYYPSDNLPEEGWFQACFHCRTITSNTIRIKNKNTCFEIIEYDTYLCRPCQKEMNDDERYSKFFKKCNEHIKKRQALLRRRSSSFASSAPTTPISFSPLSSLSYFSSSPEF